MSGHNAPRPAGLPPLTAPHRSTPARRRRYGTFNGFGKTVFLIVNTMIGAGILNMPQVFAKSGLLLGLGMFAVTAWATWAGLVLLVRVGMETGIMDYGALSEKVRRSTQAHRHRPGTGRN